MRFLPLLLIVPAIGSCTGVPPAQSAAVIAREQARLDMLTAGKVAGPPMSCLPHYRTIDMRVINDGTVVFRESASRVYINHMDGGCTNLSNGNTLVTRTTQTSLCRGDIAEVVDPVNHMTVGGCAFGDFIPYARPAG
jgi:hypothetical protein